MECLHVLVGSMQACVPCSAGAWVVIERHRPLASFRVYVSCFPAQLKVVAFIVLTERKIEEHETQNIQNWSESGKKIQQQRNPHHQKVNFLRRQEVVECNNPRAFSLYRNIAGVGTKRNEDIEIRTIGCGGWRKNGRRIFCVRHGLQKQHWMGKEGSLRAENKEDKIRSIQKAEDSDCYYCPNGQNSIHNSFRTIVQRGEGSLPPHPPIHSHTLLKIRPTSPACMPFAAMRIEEGKSRMSKANDVYHWVKPRKGWG